MKTFVFVALFAIFAMALAAPADVKADAPKDLQTANSFGFGYGLGPYGLYNPYLYGPWAGHLFARYGFYG
ncbi:hypothetical protein Ocin01_05263 [Orchesella cincta]|uniref:Uncharacterized protein n=1 Tax=Orchesella cincta TaxID=48709 RepID=A0A1D2N873_ORCCI|nr:hypothetical protein Ocin01_05263 [Orchesella cincta]